MPQGGPIRHRGAARGGHRQIAAALHNSSGSVLERPAIVPVIPANPLGHQQNTGMGICLSVNRDENPARFCLQPGARFCPLLSVSLLPAALENRREYPGDALTQLPDMAVRYSPTEGSKCPVQNGVEIERRAAKERDLVRGGGGQMKQGIVVEWRVWQDLQSRWNLADVRGWRAFHAPGKASMARIIASNRPQPRAQGGWGLQQNAGEIRLEMAQRRIHARGGLTWDCLS